MSPELPWDGFLCREKVYRGQETRGVIGCSEDPSFSKENVLCYRTPYRYISVVTRNILQSHEKSVTYDAAITVCHRKANSL